MTTWVRDFTAGVAGDDMDPAKGVGKLLEFLLRDVEKGRTLPNGWDTGLSEEQRSWDVIKTLMEKNQVQRWPFAKARKKMDASVVDVAGKTGDVGVLLVAIDDRVSEIGNEDRKRAVEGKR